MKKLFSILFVVAIFAGISFGQGYQKGVNNLNIGIGFGDVVGGYGTQSLPPISVGLQFGIEDKISVGGILGYSSSSEEWFYGKYKYTYIIIGARGEYHFLEPSNNFDVYGGVTLGYNIVSSSWEANHGYSGYSATASGSDLFYGFHAGARYAFSPKFGAFAEVGYGLGIINIGVNFKL
ncbi:MAG: outer membrane beta-barrel protein [Bacteroidota bacterium]|nr:outer membrane beta-barrel protein [Bacteroidota bacterium]